MQHQSTDEMEAFITNIRKLIAQDDLQSALQQLQTFLQQSPHLHEVIIQNARFTDISKQIRLGIVEHGDANLTKNQIRYGLLELLEELEQKDKQEVFKQEMQNAISIVNSKNVVVNSPIQAGGNVSIGDKNITQNAEKIYNIEQIDRADFS